MLAHRNGNPTLLKMVHLQLKKYCIISGSSPQAELVFALAVFFIPIFKE